MSDTISFDRSAMDEELGRMRTDADGVASSLRDVPAAADGGIGSDLIALITAAGADAAALGADSVTALVVIASDVLDEFADNETAAVAELTSLADEMNAS